MAIIPYSFPSPRVGWGRGNSATVPQCLATSLFPTVCKACHLISCSAGVRRYRSLPIH